MGIYINKVRLKSGVCMSIPKIHSGYTFGYSLPAIDLEEKEIMNKLMAYGVTPTGDKATDKATLRRIEEQKAKEENVVSNKFLTVSSNEQEKIQENKKTKRKENNTGKNQVSTGANILGQQVYLAIRLKNQKD